MIEIKNLTKQYPNIMAVDHLNLKINTGEFFGLLGPNGAGKTTLIRMLSTLTPMSSGSIMINGILMDRNTTDIKSKIGVVPQNVNLEWNMTAEQNLILHGKLFGMNRVQMKQRINDLLNYVELYDRKDDRVQTFSGGMKRKLMIARALLHEPEVLLMDEPTVGLDASVRRKLWDLMKGLNKDGMTVILTTHYIEEAEVLCGRVGFMNAGKIVEMGTPKHLIEKFGSVVLEVFEDGQTQLLFFNSREDALSKAAELRCDINIRLSNLEDTFITLTNRKVGG